MTEYEKHITMMASIIASGYSHNATFGEIAEGSVAIAHLIIDESTRELAKRGVMVLPRGSGVEGSDL